MSRQVLFVLLALFWFLLTWTTSSSEPKYLQELAAGLIVALLVTWVVGEPAKENSAAWLEPKRYMWFVAYLFVLAAYIVRANMEVAYRVLHPAMPIRPGIVRVRTRLCRPAARTLLCNSITLCPGTLTLDIWEDGTMLVHWIYVRTEDESEAGERIIGRFEWFIEKILE